MNEEFARESLIIGEDGIQKLSQAKVAIFGIGGVGGHVVDALARCGIGYLELIDNDIVEITNINRQLVARHSTIGKNKVDVMEEWIHDINPNCHVEKRKLFYLPETENEFDFSSYDYVVDAIDTLSAKLSLALKCQQTNTPIIAAMGAGNKLNPTDFKVADIYQTSADPLAKRMRYELKRLGVKSLKVVYSQEQLEDSQTLPSENGRHAPGSIAFSPSVMGEIIASEVVKDLLNK